VCATTTAAALQIVVFIVTGSLYVHLMLPMGSHYRVVLVQLCPHMCIEGIESQAKTALSADLRS
jgi:hypothetical protein